MRGGCRIKSGGPDRRGNSALAAAIKQHRPEYGAGPWQRTNIGSTGMTGGRRVAGEAGHSALQTAELVKVLAAIAAKRDDELSLLQCDRTEVHGESRSVYSPQPLEALSLEGPWQYFIRSEALTPIIPASEPLPGTGWPRRFSLNGLILLHHPDPATRLARQTSASSIGVMHRVGNERTGELREHVDYDALFQAIKRRFARLARDGALAGRLPLLPG